MTSTAYSPRTESLGPAGKSRYDESFESGLTKTFTIARCDLRVLLTSESVDNTPYFPHVDRAGYVYSNSPVRPGILQLFVSDFLPQLWRLVRNRTTSSTSPILVIRTVCRRAE